MRLKRCIKPGMAILKDKYDKKISEALMQDRNSNLPASDRYVAREIHELTYWKHWLGASEGAIRSAIAKVGNDRSKIERELMRSSDSAR